MSFYPLLNFCRLQGSTHIFIGWGMPTPSKVSFLLAPCYKDLTSRIPALPRSAPRFSQPLSRLIFNSLWIYSAPQALPGLWSTEFYLKLIGNCFQLLLLLRCYCFFMVFFMMSFTAPADWSGRFTSSDLNFIRPFAWLLKPVSILKFSHTLKLCSQIKAFPTSSDFTLSTR